MDLKDVILSKEDLDGMNLKQQEIYLLAMMQHNLFISGGAGVGKTFTLKKIEDGLKRNKLNYVVLAPTGIAALNCGGATIHKFFGIDTKNTLKENLDNVVEDAKNGKRLDKLDTVNTIIIDEISMVACDIFSIISIYILVENKRRVASGKPEINLIVFGDFYQLKPVIAKNDADYYIYNNIRPELKTYAFQSPYWKVRNFTYVNLDEIVRQKDDKFFADKLNALRTGDSSSMFAIQNYVASKGHIGMKSKDSVIIAGKNRTVDDINKSELAKLNTREVLLQNDESKEGALKRAGIVESITVKPDCEILVTRNGNGYVNGTRGKFIRKGRNEDGELGVYLDVNGQTVFVERVKDETYKYEINPTTKKLEKVVDSTLWYYPIKLGYAFTVHKTQGLTLQSIHIIPEFWDEGQLYVALSRCTNLDGVSLERRLTLYDLKCSESVNRFYEGLKETKINVKAILMLYLSNR